MDPIPTQFATHWNSKVDKIVCLCHHPCLQRHLLRNKWRPAGINWNLRIKLASAILKQWQHLEKLDLLFQCRMCKEPLDSQGICYNATAKEPILEIKILPADLWSHLVPFIQNHKNDSIYNLKVSSSILNLVHLRISTWWPVLMKPVQQEWRPSQRPPDYSSLQK